MEKQKKKKNGKRKNTSARRYTGRGRERKGEERGEDLPKFDDSVGNSSLKWDIWDSRMSGWRWKDEEKEREGMDAGNWREGMMREKIKIQISEHTEKSAKHCIGNHHRSFYLIKERKSKNIPEEKGYEEKL